MKRLARAVVAALLCVSAPAGAVQPDEMLNDPVLETRARDISQNLRCLVCQNQSIDDSNAELARDLRILVRERLTAGDSDSEVVTYVVDRYGDFVLLKPPFKGSTYVLWFGPAIIALLGLIAVFVFYRRRRSVPEAAVPPPLSDAERRRLDDLLGDEDR